MDIEQAKKGKSYKRKVKRFNVMVKADLLKQLDDFCESGGYKRNQLMDVMLGEFLEKWGIDNKE